MRLGTRSRIAIAAAVLSSGALLAPAAPAAATKFPCPSAQYQCDVVNYYYSDSTKTYLVGYYQDGPCGQDIWGQETAYVERVRVYC
ncbi:MAG TPA: hypothetical protein VF557_17460 [Jatrophihabitans sp.]|jgi:hypothetical protein|uniref:hypothetical protein n=1 Tax=Jatrophihabitans sp. TaxID=1932789 RepID=UPI002F058059